MYAPISTRFGLSGACFITTLVIVRLFHEDLGYPAPIWGRLDCLMTISWILRFCSAYFRKTWIVRRLL